MDRENIKIVSLNMQHGRHIAELYSVPLSRQHVLKNLDKIGSLLMREKPDIILLQEVDRVSPITPRIDQLAHIAQGLGFEYAVHGASAKFSWGRKIFYSGGCGIISRYPILDSWSVQFDLCFPTLRKGFVAATVALPGRNITVVSTHLSPLDVINASYKKMQIERMSETLSGRSPMILGGDINSGASGLGKESILGLSSKLNLKTDPSALEGRLANFPSYWPQMKYDWIFASPELKISKYQILSERVSDHLAISASIAL